MAEQKLRTAIVGCGILGQVYAEIYASLPDAEIVALVEKNPERLASVGDQFSVAALFTDTDSLLREITPDIVAVTTPTKYYKDAVVACAQAGVKGVSTDKPSAATLADADEMVRVCEQRGVVLSGGALIRALPELQEAARRLQAGDYGPILGASVHGWSGEISGGGCHMISALRLLTEAEVVEVIAWAEPKDVLEGDCDAGLTVNGLFKLSSGLHCPAFGHGTEGAGLVQVWTADSSIRAGFEPPEISQGFDERGYRRKLDIQYSPHGWGKRAHLHGAIRSFLDAVRTGSELWISGHDLRQALEVAIASHVSAKRGSIPIKLPLEDRSLTLYPRPYRWLGGDEYTYEGEKVEGKREDLPI
jgi:predicted dehydrogenase